MMRPAPTSFTTRLAYAVVAVLALAGMHELWSYRVDASLRFARSGLQALALDVEGTAHLAVAQVRLLATAARGELAQPPAAAADASLPRFAAGVGGRTFSARGQPAESSPRAASYLVGGYAPGEIPSAVGAEMAAALRLNPLMADVASNTAAAAWVYYTSAARFTNLYPFEAPGMAEAIPWSDEFLTHPLFANSTREANPARHIRWHDAYRDQAGKGLLTSVVAPVYDHREHFRGIIGLDFTVDSLAALLQGPGVDLGTPLIVNLSGQVLAHPSATRSSDAAIKRLGELLPAALAGDEALLLGTAPVAELSRDGYRVFSAALAEAPWRVLLVVDSRALGWRTLAGMHTEFAGLALLVLLLGLMERRRRTADEYHTFKAAVEASTASILITDTAGTIEYVNPAFTHNTGYPAAEAIGRNPRMLKSGLIPAELYRELWSSLLSGRNWQGELLNRRKDGELIWEKTIISTIAGPAGEPSRFVAVKDDITEGKRAEARLRESEMRFRDLVNTIDGIVWEADASTLAFTFISDKAERLLGFPSEDWKRPGFWLERLHPDDRDWAPAFCAASTARMQDHDFEYRFIHRDGQTVWLRDLVTVVVDGGQPRLLRGVMIDISVSKRMEAELRFAASTDALTGLPNRRSFFEHLQAEHARVQRFESEIAAVLMLDLDHFKHVNDNFGHAAGDAVLQHFAGLLEAAVRKIDHIGRLGGEEFAVILPGSDLAAARSFAERLRERVAASPLKHGDGVIGVTVSIGISRFRASDASADAALIRADQALYEIKQAGRNRVKVAEEPV